MSRSNSSRSKDLDDVVSKTLSDVENLKCQIRSLLGSMDVVDNVKDAPIISLPKRVTLVEEVDERPPETRMMWQASEDSIKQKRGKTIPASNHRVIQDNVEVELSGLDIMEICINEKISKYIPVPDSVFFVPVLDRCVFGITLLNATTIKLRKPKISLSLLQPSTTVTKSQRKRLCRCLSYDVQISVKEMNLEKLDLTKTEQGLTCQDSFANYLDLSEQVMPGLEVLVTATFPYPIQVLGNSSDFSLLLSAYLDGMELWAREIPITNNYCFTAASVDDVFKTRHSSLMTALGKEHEIFKLERLLSPNGLTPYKSMERFLMPLGYEKIESVRTGSDTIIEVYTTHQPSLLWGTCFKIEKCSRKPSVIQSVVTARTKEQMVYLFTQIQSWLNKERHKDKQIGSSGITISRISSKSNLTICEKLQAEIDLIVKFQQVKNILRKEREAGRILKRRTDRRNDISSVESSWIHEYSICVERTDMAFCE